MARGYVKTVLVDRGFAFIRPDGADRHTGDVFAHQSQFGAEFDFDASLLERDVDFDIQDGPKGPRAINIKPAR